jgi:DinB family protein
MTNENQMNAIPQPAPEILNQKQELLPCLTRSRERVLEVLADVPEELSRIRLAVDSWSILECAEHIAVAERGMFMALERRTPTSAAPDVTKDELIKAVGTDRSRKFSAPERARPSGRFANVRDAVAGFCSARDRTIAFLEQTEEDLRKSVAVHLLGTFDAYQYLLIMAAHAERHALQIEEIKHCPAYREAQGKQARYF